MVDLSQIELASEEDKAYEIDRWARLFKARTWEELRMIAKNDPNLQQASNDLYVINADKIMRQQARARADAIALVGARTIKYTIMYWREHFRTNLCLGLKKRFECLRMRDPYVAGQQIDLFYL